MAFATNDVKLGKNHYRIALHGVAAGDRPYPHIHIYLENDHYPWKKFNFEISLVDLICDDELNLVCQQDNTYNEENNQKNSLQNYVKSQGKSILTKYKKHFE